MGTKRNVDMSMDNQEIKIVGNPDAADTTKNLSAANSDDTADAAKTTTDQTSEETAPKKIKKPTRQRSARYNATRSQVDKTKNYDPLAAVEMVKKLSYSKFDGTITAHLLVKEAGISVSLTLPHSTGKTIKVAIVTDQVIKDIEAGQIDFDILLSTKEFMPKLTKFARTLGPKGLMPNPKRGTLTTNPEAKKKELEGGKMLIRTEKKAPVMHITIGKVSMDTKQLLENLQTLTTALSYNLVKVSLAASMSPGVKVKVEKVTR